MKSRSASLALLVAALALPPAAARAATGTRSPTFGLAAPWTKIGDAANQNNPTWGSGKNVVATGTEVYVAWTSDDTGWSCPAGCDVQIWVGRSLDGGLTWERNVLVARSVDYEWNGAQLAVGPDPANPGGRRLHVVWGDETHDTILHASAPLDPALGAFSAPAVVSGAWTTDAYGGSIAADPRGGVHVIFSGWDPATGRRATLYSSSADGGTTFAEIATELPAVPDGQDPAIATDPAGDVFVVARNYPGFAFWRRLAGASTWTGPVAIAGITNDEPSIAAFDASTIHVSGLVLASGLQSPAVASTSSGGVTTGAWTVKTVGAPMSYGDVKPIAVDAAGNVAVAWVKDGSAWVARSTTRGSTWSAPVVAIAGGGAWLSDVNLAFDPAGKILVDVARDNTIVFTREK